MKPTYKWSPAFGVWIADRPVAGFPVWLNPGAPVFS